MFRVVARLVREEQGQDLIEYALLAGLIVLICVATLTAMGQKLNTFYFSKIDQAMP